MPVDREAVIGVALGTEPNVLPLRQHRCAPGSRGRAPRTPRRSVGRHAGSRRNPRSSPRPTGSRCACASAASETRSTGSRCSAAARATRSTSAPSTVGVPPRCTRPTRSTTPSASRTIRARDDGCGRDAAHVGATTRRRRPTRPGGLRPRGRGRARRRRRLRASAATASWSWSASTSDRPPVTRCSATRDVEQRPVGPREHGEIVGRRRSAATSARAARRPQRPAGPGAAPACPADRRRPP